MSRVTACAAADDAATIKASRVLAAAGGATPTAAKKTGVIAPTAAEGSLGAAGAMVRAADKPLESEATASTAAGKITAGAAKLSAEGREVISAVPRVGVAAGAV
jgi:hypothetical protein